MSDSGVSTDDIERSEIVDNIDDLRDHLQSVREDKHRAVGDGDTEAASYAGGKEAGLIAGIAVLEELVDDD